MRSGLAFISSKNLELVFLEEPSLSPELVPVGPRSELQCATCWESSSPAICFFSWQRAFSLLPVCSLAHCWAALVFWAVQSRVNTSVPSCLAWGRWQWEVGRRRGEFREPGTPLSRLLLLRQQCLGGAASGFSGDALGSELGPRA